MTRMLRSLAPLAVLGSSVAAAALLVLAFLPMLLPGPGINIALVWLALAGPWSPA